MATFICSADGVSSCTGCRLCLPQHDFCDDCKKPMREGDKFYRLYKKTVCEDCVTDPEGEICTLCRKSAEGGFKYGDIILCRSCSGVATGYYGYI